jgi:hypothetical protein
MKAKLEYGKDGCIDLENVQIVELERGKRYVSGSAEIDLSENPTEISKVMSRAFWTDYISICIDRTSEDKLNDPDFLYKDVLYLNSVVLSKIRYNSDRAFINFFSLNTEQKRKIDVDKVISAYADFYKNTDDMDKIFSSEDKPHKDLKEGCADLDDVFYYITVEDREISFPECISVSWEISPSGSHGEIIYSCSCCTPEAVRYLMDPTQKINLVIGHILSNGQISERVFQDVEFKSSSGLSCIYDKSPEEIITWSAKKFLLLENIG